MSDFKQFHHVSACGTCVVCGQPATHKIGEEISQSDPEFGTLKFESGREMKQHRHNFTGHVCCIHFRMLFGSAVFCPEANKDSPRFCFTDSQFDTVIENVERAVMHLENLPAANPGVVFSARRFLDHLKMNRLTVKVPFSSSIFTDIIAERERQDAQWGGSDHDDAHMQDDWSLFISNFADKAENAENDDEYRRRLVQIAALAVAAIESIDRYHAKS